ncbi:MAG TPA: glycoside hydrolase family 36 protein [Acidobacteriaceae bacterium]|nr:glycoside hydrolase family 36 protein [Acidobacteriaceae bacterium]
MKVAHARMALLLALGFFFPARNASAEVHATLVTADTTIEVAGGPEAPRLVSLAGHNARPWRNRSVDTLPPWVEREGKRLPLHWRLVPGAAAVDSHHVAIVYQTTVPRLRLTWEWSARAPFGPLEHTVTIRNRSGVELWLPIPDSLHVDWQVPDSAELRNLYIDKGAGAPTDQGTHLDPVPMGYSWTGWSSTFAHPVPGHPREIIPFEAIFAPQPDAAGWFAGIEFSGRTRIALARTPAGLTSDLGLDPDPGPALTRLIPGGDFSTPRIFLGSFTGGPDGAGNQLRPWVRRVLGSPRTWDDPEYPITVNNSWGVGMSISDATARRMIADASSLGFEMFHLDAGWFRGVGDWYPNPQKFPNGLAPIAEDAHHHGMRFGLWVDWAQAGIDTEPGALNLNDPKVRNWLVADIGPGWKPQDFKGQTIDLGVPAAHDYAAREVDRIVTTNHLDMLEHDGYLVAQGCTRDDHPHAPPDRQHMQVEHYDGEDIVLSSNSTDVSYHAVEAYYDIYAHLRKTHPGLLFEICNDGGRMVDFGAAAHGDYFSITDSYDPLSNRRAFYDASYVLPPPMLETYVDKWPTPHLGNFVYELRSGMMGWFSVMQDTNAWTADQHEAARRELALYKSRLRPLIRDARLFHVAPRPDGVHWDGIEYWDPARRAGVVFAFHGSSASEPTHRYVLDDLNSGKSYRIHFEDGSSQDTIASGRQLMEKGLTVDLPQPLTSELIFLSEH